MPNTQVKQRDSQDTKNTMSFDEADEKRLLSQVEAEYKNARDALSSKKQEWARRLKLFNNQKRNPKDVGDPLLYTIFMTVLASIYQDQMIVEWIGHEEGDDPQAENLNHLSKFDFDEMQKSIVDYVWDWDSLFFGRGMIEFTGFDRKSKTPTISVIDPFSFYRDPHATSFNDSPVDKGCRFWGQDIEMTKQEIKRSGYKYIEKIEQTEIKIDADIEEGKKARNEAQNIQDVQESDEFGDNKRYQLIKWFTHFNGKKCLVVTTNDFNTVVAYKPLRNQEVWLAVDRPSSMMSRSWDGVSIPDLVEDKQRARSIIENVNLQSIQNLLYTHYLYNPVSGLVVFTACIAWKIQRHLGSVI